MLDVQQTEAPNLPMTLWSDLSVRAHQLYIALIARGFVINRILSSDDEPTAFRDTMIANGYIDIRRRLLGSAEIDTSTNYSDDEIASTFLGPVFPTTGAIDARTTAS